MIKAKFTVRDSTAICRVKLLILMGMLRLLIVRHPYTFSTVKIQIYCEHSIKGQKHILKATNTV